MIERDEIDSKSAEFDVHIANVERDYVFGWLLKSIYENEYLSNLLVFKGGNCMRKAYYADTRFSHDLDFSVQSSIDEERFRNELNRSCEAAQQICGVHFETQKNTFCAEQMIDKTRQSYKGRVYFRDFYGNNDHISISVKFDVTEFDKLFIAPVSRLLIHPYSDTNLCIANLRCMALEELVANKLKCLIQRRHSYDLYDLVYATFFDRSIELDRGLVLKTFLQKTIFQPSPAAAKEILLGLPAAFFRTAWEKYVTPKCSRFNFDQAFEGFTTSIEGLFAEITPRSWGVDAFYPSQYRNVIMEAGVGRKIMRMKYHGEEREIEPYSLSYKRPQSGDAKEYFYAYDLTGGRSGPGIKTFLHCDIEKLELTEKSFEPRYEIELSKSGETARQGYFGKPFSSQNFTTPRRSSISRIASNQNYTVECPYCQKRFKRNKYSTRLNPHTDGNGYKCHGRLGYIV